MDEKSIVENVTELVDEERTLREQAVGQGLDEAGRARLRDLEARLDQCWDLMRQRRARAEFGGDPDEARVRPAGEVEGYLE